MSMNKQYIMAGMLATAIIAPLSDTTESYASEIRVTTTRVHFRTGAGTSYDSMGVLEKGTKVNYIGVSGNWAKVEYNSKTGYIHSDYLTTQASSSSTTTTMYVISSSGLNVRKGPSTSYDKVGTLSTGTAVTVHSTSNGWSKISANGIEGYVSSQYLSATKPSTSNGTSSSTTSTMYVTASDGLNVRKGPSTSYSKVGNLPKGTAVTVHSTSNGWSKISANGIEGYVSSQYLSATKPSTSNGTSSSTTSTMYVTASDGLNVRKGPSTSYSKVANLPKGTAVTVYSTSNGWSKISANGIEGYVSSQYLSTTKPSSTETTTPSTGSSVDAVLNFANKQMGKPYVWGAEGPSSFDCSGFTYYVYKNAAGITLPRVSADQSKYGTTVSKSNLRAGDLVFFDTSGSNNGAVSHVGIYIGGGQMIHCSSSKGQVIKTSIETNYWVNAFVRAKRVL